MTKDWTINECENMPLIVCRKTCMLVAPTYCETFDEANYRAPVNELLLMTNSPIQSFFTIPSDGGTFSKMR